MIVNESDKLDLEIMIEYIVSKIDQDDLDFDGSGFGIDTDADPFEVILTEYTHPEGTRPRQYRARISVDITPLSPAEPAGCCALPDGHEPPCLGGPTGCTD